jgi:hypothetical protein
MVSGANVKLLHQTNTVDHGPSHSSNTLAVPTDSNHAGNGGSVSNINHHNSLRVNPTGSSSPGGASHAKPKVIEPVDTTPHAMVHLLLSSLLTYSYAPAQGIESLLQILDDEYVGVSSEGERFIRPFELQHLMKFQGRSDLILRFMTATLPNSQSIPALLQKERTPCSATMSDLLAEAQKVTRQQRPISFNATGTVIASNAINGNGNGNGNNNNVNDGNGDGNSISKSNPSHVSIESIRDSSDVGSRASPTSNLQSSSSTTTAATSSSSSSSSSSLISSSSYGPSSSHSSSPSDSTVPSPSNVLVKKTLYDPANAVQLTGVDLINWNVAKTYKATGVTQPYLSAKLASSMLPWNIKQGSWHGNEPFVLVGKPNTQSVYLQIEENAYSYLDNNGNRPSIVLYISTDGFQSSFVPIKLRGDKSNKNWKVATFYGVSNESISNTEAEEKMGQLRVDIKSLLQKVQHPLRDKDGKGGTDQENGGSNGTSSIGTNGISRQSPVSETTTKGRLELEAKARSVLGLSKHSNGNVDSNSASVSIDNSRVGSRITSRAPSTVPSQNQSRAASPTPSMTPSISRSSTPAFQD